MDKIDSNMKKEKKHTPNIKDIAKAANVSPATVSYVLSGKRPISKETKEKVLRLIKEYGYTPDINAVALKIKKGLNIGLLVSDFSEPFTMQIIRGVERVAREMNYYIVYTSSAEFNNNFDDAVDFLERRRIDGLLILFAISYRKEIDIRLELDLPTVSINRLIDKKHPCVLPDNIDGGYKAAIHLLESGTTKIGIISGPETRSASRERIIGFKKALEERNINFTNDLIYYGNFDYESGYRGFEELVRRHPDIEGVFCANDDMAAGAMNAALKMDIKVPDRMKILGFDNKYFSSIWPIPISTFEQPLEKMGMKGASLLFSMINNEKIENNTILLKSILIPRESTGYYA